MAERDAGSAARPLRPRPSAGPADHDAAPHGGEQELHGMPGASIGQSNPVDLNRTIHERVRLGIVSALAVADSLTFNELKALLKATDGNLSVHARKLEDAGYIDCHKSFDGRIPRTEYRLTPRGRQALQRYLEHMEALIQAVREE